MTEVSTTPERFGSPKEISDELCRRFGYCVSESYVRAIRAESLMAGEKMFVGGMARPSDVFEWLRLHPAFNARKAIHRARTRQVAS